MKDLREKGTKKMSPIGDVVFIIRFVNEDQEIRFLLRLFTFFYGKPLIMQPRIVDVDWTKMSIVKI